jgi:hypothetical protein
VDWQFVLIGAGEHPDHDQAVRWAIQAPAGIGGWFQFKSLDFHSY